MIPTRLGHTLQLEGIIVVLTMRTEMEFICPGSPALNVNSEAALARKLPELPFVSFCSSAVPSSPVIVMYTSPSKGSEFEEVVTATWRCGSEGE